MKITDIKLHVLKNETPALATSHDGLFEDTGPGGVIKYSLIRILTDEGIEGHYIVWSEISSGRPGSLTDVISCFRPHLIGEDPLNREKIWQKLGAFWYGLKGPAFAAIDICLWDIAGKAANLPIYKLIGAYRDKVLAYASGNVPKDTEEIVRIGVDLKKRNYKAMKMHPVPIEACAPLREAVGDDVDLIYDAVFTHSREEALKVGRELDRLNYRWYEAPLPAGDIEGYIHLRNKLDTPITVELMNESDYREYITRGAVDYLRTLSGVRGGITEMIKAASLCESFAMNWEPHSYGGTLYQAATLHVILSRKNCAFFELPIQNGEEGWFDVGTTDVIRIDKEGYVHGPCKPGLGYEIDWEQVEIENEEAVI
jgi:L-alanine-DL-glutamate epimerase-like enolase superfamily enzyme